MRIVGGGAVGVDSFEELDASSIFPSVSGSSPLWEV